MKRVKKTIGFIGAGNMAGAIIKGLRSAGTAGDLNIIASDVRRERLEELKKELDVAPARSNGEVCRKADAVILAVKPGQVNKVLGEVAGCLDGGKLLISIAAGVTLFQIESRLRRRTRLIRAMPNTPLLTGKGMTAIACGTSVREADRAFVLGLFGSVGRVIEVDEILMDAVTALSGSGPAYVFGFIEALADGGVRVGIPRSEALLLAAQTVAGAAEMVLTTGKHPGELKDMVTSPGGTTIHGYGALEAGGFRGLVIGAVVAAFQRAREIATGQA